jgi:hypothetical protein
MVVDWMPLTECGPAHIGRDQPPGHDLVIDLNKA